MSIHCKMVRFDGFYTKEELKRLRKKGYKKKLREIRKAQSKEKIKQARIDYLKKISTESGYAGFGHHYVGKRNKRKR